MKNLKAILLVAIFLSFSHFQTLAQIDTQKNTDFIKSSLHKHFPADEPGVTLIVAQGDKILFKGAAGMANLELGIPMDANHILRIGSITKQFTAVSILMLQEQGKLDVQDPITKYLPDYPTHDKKITIEHLLTHTSGIQSYTSIPGFMENVRNDMTTTELIDIFKDKKMNFDPGEDYRYNNSGYFLLGVIIEKVSGMTYEDFVEKNIFQKLGMNDSHYDQPSDIIPRRITGYHEENGKFVNAPYLSMTIPYAAGSLISTVEDLWIWNKALHSHKLITKKSLEKAHTAYTLKNGESIDYGYGWGVDEYYNQKVIEHSGGIHGFTTNALYLPKEKLFVAAFSNGNDPTFLTRLIGATLIGGYPNVKKMSLSKKELADYAGVYEVENSSHKRTIRVKDDHLTSIRTGGELYNIYAFEKDKFYFENSMTIFEFKRDANGKVLGILAHLANGNKGKAVKTDEVIKEQKEVQLSDEILKKYVGKYEIQPGFNLEFTLKDNSLWAQPTGESKLQVFAKNETQFYLKAIDAKIEFVKIENEIGEVRVNIGGEKHVGKKIK